MTKKGTYMVIGQIQTIEFTNELQKTTKVRHKLQSLLIDYFTNRLQKTTKVRHRLQSLLIGYKRLQKLDIDQSLLIDYKRLQMLDIDYKVY